MFRNKLQTTCIVWMKKRCDHRMQGEITGTDNTIAYCTVRNCELELNDQVSLFLSCEKSLFPVEMA